MINLTYQKKISTSKFRFLRIFFEGKRRDGRRPGVLITAPMCPRDQYHFLSLSLSQRDRQESRNIEEPLGTVFCQDEFHEQLPPVNIYRIPQYLRARCHYNLVSWHEIARKQPGDRCSISKQSTKLTRDPLVLECARHYPLAYPYMKTFQLVPWTHFLCRRIILASMANSCAHDTEWPTDDCTSLCVKLTSPFRLDCRILTPNQQRCYE